MDADQSLKDKIQHELEIYYYDDIVDNMNGRRNYKTVSDVMEVLGHIALLISITVSFSAGYFDYNILSFIAGGLGTLSVGLFGFSTYALKESKERTIIVNTILKSLNMKEIVDIALDVSDTDNNNSLKDVVVNNPSSKNTVTKSISEDH